MGTAKPQLVVLGNPENCKASLESLSAACDITYLLYENYEMGDSFSIPPAVIICSMPNNGCSTAEVAQSLRMNYPNEAIYYLVDSRESFNRVELQKNGFTDAFLLPNDKLVFETALKRDIAIASNGEMQVFRKVQLVDVEPGIELGFDLFLHFPANNRHVKYVSSKDTLNKEQTERLAKHQVRSAAVTENQVANFYKFTADRLRALGKNDAISATEKSERQQKAVRSLLAGIFSSAKVSDSIQDGRGIMQDCNEIVKTYVMAEASNSWYERFLKITASSNGTYGHAADVSSLAALLAIGLGLQNIEEIALAGLLHDIGTADLPAAICEKPAAQRTAEENIIYQTHPQHSVDMIKNKKMIVSEKVLKIILQHHERHDGTGYPNRTAGDRNCVEAQVLRVADELEKIISEESQHGHITPQQAVKKLLTENAAPIGPKMVSMDLARKILALLS